MKNIIGIISLCLFAFIMEGQAQINEVKSDVRFVMAKGGLSMRQSHQIDARRMLVLPYGAKVEVLEPANAQFIIDNIEAGMVKIKYNEKVGYAYEGYLSRYPGPKLINEFEGYVNQIRRERKNAIYEYYRKDLDGVEIVEKTVVFYDANWLEAILAARELIPFVKKHPVPTLKNIEDKLANEIKKDEEGMYTNTMEVSYASGEIAAIKIMNGHEGGAQTVTIAPNTENYENGLMIKLTMVAD